MSALLNQALASGKVVVRKADLNSGETRLFVPNKESFKIVDGDVDLTARFSLDEIRKSNLKQLIEGGKLVIIQKL